MKQTEEFLPPNQTALLKTIINVFFLIPQKTRQGQVLLIPHGQRKV